jgi:hypothetical protein
MKQIRKPIEKKSSEPPHVSGLEDPLFSEKRREITVMNRKRCDRARQASLVLAAMAEDLNAVSPPEAKQVSGAVLWTSFRVVHWLNEAARSGQIEMMLRCLAETSCTNLALRGILLEEDTLKECGRRRRQLLLSQSRRVGRLVMDLCEVLGRTMAKTEKTGFPLVLNRSHCGPVGETR